MRESVPIFQSLFSDHIQALQFHSELRVRLNDLYFPGDYRDGGLKKGDVILVSSPRVCISITPPMENCGGCDRSQVLISPFREDVLPRSEDAWQF